MQTGKIVSGDMFVSDPTTRDILHPAADDVMCVEMEGAAVAQICKDYDVPCLVIRTISDKADHSAAIDFQKFVKEVGSYISADIAHEFVRSSP